MAWAHQQLKGFDVALPPIPSYPSVEVLAKEVEQSLKQVREVTGKSPKVLVMGAKGTGNFCCNASSRRADRHKQGDAAAEPFISSRRPRSTVLPNGTWQRRLKAVPSKKSLSMTW